MINLNPHGNPDAIWQHGIMFAVALLIGYLIGHIDARQKRSILEEKLSRLDADLESCISRNAPLFRSSDGESVPLTPVKVRPDDLKTIEGIGPKIQELLNFHGIYTFQQLSESSFENLTRILTDSGVKFKMHDPHTWPQQAHLAANQMWQELKELQNELNRGS